jgi:MoaA/NifB/PqqE/SkfB family radical SAM enzyme
MCDITRQDTIRQQQGLREFDTARFCSIIEELAALGVAGIGFTGGEPLLRPDIFELLACARRHGLIARLNTNGFLLGDEAARRLIASGADSVNISLDGARAATHDRFRNHSGAFERATTAINLLHRMRTRQNARLRIKVVSVVDETNIDEAADLVTLSQELGADCIDFIPRQSFAEGERTLGDAALMVKVGRLAEYLRSAQKAGAPIENSPAHLQLFRASFAGLPSPVRCQAGYNSLAVDCYGDVFPCVPWINWGKTAGNVRDKGLAQLWHSAEYQPYRRSTGACRECYLNCQTELNLLFDLRARLRLWRERQP